MSGPADAAAIALRWVEKAESDLKTAEHTLKLGDDAPADTVCFHAQQCVEKYLKALLVHRHIEFPRSHDLTELAVLLPPGDRGAIPLAELPELNPYAVETRYPGDWDEVTGAEASRAVDIARRVRAAARALLPLPPEASSG